MNTPEAATMVTMGQRAWQIEPDRFAAWNTAGSLDGAVEALKRLVDGPLPRWAVRVRAAELINAGVVLKEFPKAA